MLTRQLHVGKMRGVDELVVGCEEGQGTGGDKDRSQVFCLGDWMVDGALYFDGTSERG